MGHPECSACGSRGHFSGGSFLLGNLGQDTVSICEMWLINGWGETHTPGFTQVSEALAQISSRVWLFMCMYAPP